MILWMILSLAALLGGGLLSDQSLEGSGRHVTAGIVIALGGLLSLAACLATILYGMLP